MVRRLRDVLTITGFFPSTDALKMELEELRDWKQNAQERQRDMHKRVSDLLMLKHGLLYVCVHVMYCRVVLPMHLRLYL